MPDNRYLEDIVSGETSKCRPITISEEAIIAFSRAFDPQTMHVDQKAAAAGRFGGIIASGWHNVRTATLHAGRLRVVLNDITPANAAALEPHGIRVIAPAGDHTLHLRLTPAHHAGLAG